MFRIKKSKLFFKDKVKKLMREGKNDKLKTLIENEETYPTLSDSTGTTLLHMAARYDNIDMMQYSIDTGCGIDAKDASGTTLLIVATKYNNNSAMKFLLRANADIFVTNSAGEYPLQSAFNRENRFFYSDVLKMYCKKVKDSSSSFEEASIILLEAGCSLEHAAIIEDAKMTQAILDNIERIDERESTRSVKTSMILIDNANLQVLLSHGTQMSERREDFFSYFQDMTNTEVIQKEQIKFYKQPKTLESVKVFSKAIIDYNLLSQNKVKYVIYILRQSNKDILKIFLESGIIDYAQEVLGYSILPHVYGNRNTGVVDLLKKMKIHSKARKSVGLHGVSALHVAAHRCIFENIKQLLHAQVDVNVADKQGKTALLYILQAKEDVADKINCVDLLLRSNADVEICDEADTSFIEYVELNKEDHLALANRVLAHMAILDATGLPVKQSTIDYINAHEKLKNRYETCQHELDEMKERKVAGFLSFLKWLTSKPNEIAHFFGAQDEEIITSLTHGDSLSEFNEYYSKKLKDHLDRALKVYKLRTEMVFLIVENISSFRGHDFVVDKIISYFSEEDLFLIE